MNLIEQIKQAESQATQVIEQAKVQVTEQVKKANQQQNQSLGQAEQERKKAIETAIKTAEQQGLKEIENLKTQADKTKQQLHKKTIAAIPLAVDKIMQHLKD